MTETLTLRTGSREAARRFADRIDLTDVAPRIAQPLLVVEGGRDVLPGIVNGAPLARQAPAGRYFVVDEGDHLLSNARNRWLGYTADWLLDALDEAADR